MSSLRKGAKRQTIRPTISAPIPSGGGLPVQRAAGGGLPTDGPRPRPRPAPSAGGKTSDYVKRRYSTRYNIPENFDVTAAPPIPSVPTLDKYEPYRRNAVATEAPKPRGGPAGSAPAVDVKALRGPRFNPDAFVGNALADVATDDDIREYADRLERLETRAAGDLQQNVYQNRTQFIKISKEAEALKGQMRALKNLMSDLKTNTTVLRSTSSKANDDSSSMNGDSFSATLSKRDRRSSVADRTALWNAQMQVSTIWPLAWYSDC